MNKKAAIDIGSNSIRYLGPDGERQLITTRLAENIITTHALGDAAIERSIAALEHFAALAREQGAAPFAYATSAVRDAQCGSRERFLAEAEKIMPVRVLSGEEEARFALLGAGVEPGGGLIDIGGGSCQLVTDGFEFSAPMGCVRAKDICAANAQDDSFEALQRAVFAECEKHFIFPRIRIMDWFGVGGTITTLAALALGLKEYDAAAVDQSILTRERADELARSLHAAGDEARRREPLLIKRHDVIVPGALVLLYAMRGMGIRALRPKTADGLDGYYVYICRNM